MCTNWKNNYWRLSKWGSPCGKPKSLLLADWRNTRSTRVTYLAASRCEDHRHPTCPLPFDSGLSTCRLQSFSIVCLHLGCDCLHSHGSFMYLWSSMDSWRKHNPIKSFFHQRHVHATTIQPEFDEMLLGALNNELPNHDHDCVINCPSDSTPCDSATTQCCHNTSIQPRDTHDVSWTDLYAPGHTISSAADTHYCSCVSFDKWTNCNTGHDFNHWSRGTAQDASGFDNGTVNHFKWFASTRSYFSSIHIHRYGLCEWRIKTDMYMTWNTC